MIWSGNEFLVRHWLLRLISCESRTICIGKWEVCSCLGFFLFSLYFLICFAAALRRVSLKKYQELSICWSMLGDLANLKEIRCDWIVSLNLFQFSVVVLVQLNLLLGCLSLGDCVP